MDFENIMMQLFPMFPMFPTFTIFASETMGPIYFETFQSLQITNIVFISETLLVEYDILYPQQYKLLFLIYSLLKVTDILSYPLNAMLLLIQRLLEFHVVDFSKTSIESVWSSKMQDKIVIVRSC
jgi:hypothetical protein